MRTRRCSVVFFVIVTLVLLAGAPAALAYLEVDAGPGLQPLDLTQSFATSPATGAMYGASVAYSDGVSVVGAPGAEDWGGAAYVAMQSGELWLQQLLTLDAAAPMDSFGAAVAAGDETVVVSAPYRTVGANEGQGAVYVYGPSDDTWELKATLTAADGAAGDSFGTAVALSGDTLVVGASDHAHGGTLDAGAVYVFTRSAGVWSQRAMLTASAPVVNGWFGRSVCLDGDTLGVGSPGEDAYDGAAYVFTGAGASWTQQARLSVGTTDGEFGSALDVSDDTLLVSSSFKGSNGAYVFTRSGSTWSAGTELTAPSVADWDGFGAAVAVSGDVAAVGASAQAVEGTDGAGAVYTFTRQDGAWGSPTRIPTPNAGDGGFFGDALDLAQNNLAIGAPGESTDEETSCGVAYLGIPSVGPSVNVSYPGGRWQAKPATLYFSADESVHGAPVQAAQYWMTGVSHMWTGGTKLRVSTQGITRLQFRGVDVNGTPGDVKRVVLRIDTRRPHVVAGAATASGGAISRLTYTVADPSPGCGYAHVRLAVLDASGRVLTRSASQFATTNARHAVRVRTGGLAPGTYRVQWRATDIAGNVQHGVTISTLTVR